MEALIDLSFYAESQEELRKLYLRKRRLVNLWYQLILEMMMDIGYSNHINGNVLEVGCGVGSFCQILSKKCQNVIGLDLDKNAIETAKSLSRKVDFVIGDAQLLPFKEGVFSVVVCAETLEHVPNDKRVLEEIHKVTEMSGHVFVAIPNYFSSGRFNQFLRSILGAWNQSRDLHVYHYLKIKKLFVQLQLKILEIKGTNLIHIPFINMRLRLQESALRNFLCNFDKKLCRRLCFLGTTIGVAAEK